MWYRMFCLLENKPKSHPLVCGWRGNGYSQPEEKGHSLNLESTCLTAFGVVKDDMVVVRPAVPRHSWLARRWNPFTLFHQ